MQPHPCAQPSDHFASLRRRPQTPRPKRPRRRTHRPVVIRGDAVVTQPKRVPSIGECFPITGTAPNYPPANTPQLQALSPSRRKISAATRCTAAREVFMP